MKEQQCTLGQVPVPRSSEYMKATNFLMLGIGQDMNKQEGETMCIALHHLSVGNMKRQVFYRTHNVQHCKISWPELEIIVSG